MKAKANMKRSSKKMQQGGTEEDNSARPIARSVGSGPSPISKAGRMKTTVRTSDGAYKIVANNNNGEVTDLKKKRTVKGFLMGAPRANKPRPITSEEQRRAIGINNSVYFKKGGSVKKKK